MSHRILVIEDSLLDLEMLTRVLEKNTFKVEHAENGESGLTKLGYECRFHAVMVNLKLPDIDGYELVRRIKNRCPAIPVVVVTGLEDPRTRAKIMEAGAVMLFTKPYTSEDNHSLLALLSIASESFHIGQLSAMKRQNMRTTISGLMTPLGAGIAGIPIGAKALGGYVNPTVGTVMIMCGLMLAVMGPFFVGLFAADAKKLKDHMAVCHPEESE